MFHPIHRRYKTIAAADLVPDEQGQVVRRSGVSLGDMYARIDEDLEEL